MSFHEVMKDDLKFTFNPVPSKLSNEKMLYQNLANPTAKFDIQPLANPTWNLKRCFNKLEDRRCQNWYSFSLKNTPYEQETLEKTTFYPGNMYVGDRNFIGMEGLGIFKFPHGSTYVGGMKEGIFHGYGIMRFPSKAMMIGKWTEGVLHNPTYMFEKGCVYEPNHEEWGYCRMPDRRFETEISNGLKPAGNVLMSNDDPSPDVPPGCLDIGEGFYKSDTTELLHPTYGYVIRLEGQPPVGDYRRHGEMPFPFNPSLYENWFPETNRSKEPLARSTRQTWFQPQPQPQPQQDTVAKKEEAPKDK